MRQVSKIGTICKLCRHLCDRENNGNLVVCGMHPYGPGDESECEDFEKLGKGAPSTSRFLPFQGASSVTPREAAAAQGRVNFAEVNRIASRYELVALELAPALNCSPINAAIALHAAERDYGQTVEVLRHRILSGNLVLEDGQLVEVRSLLPSIGGESDILTQVRKALEILRSLT